MTQKNTINNMNKNSIKLVAINPFEQINIPQPIQKERSNADFIVYGDRNDYPEYLLSLYEDCSTLKSIIEGNIKFILGDDMTFRGEKVSQEFKYLVSNLVRDYYIFGYAFIHVMRSTSGDIADLEYVKSEKIRMSKDRERFFYCNKWSLSSNNKVLEYPSFNTDDKEQLDSIIMFGNGRNVYPQPLWSSVIKEVEVQVRISDFHLNEIENNFLSSAIINFNNGRPSSEEQDEIERNINEKFSGSQNGGRILLSFNESLQNRTTIERLGGDNFDSRYLALLQKTREQIFISFSAQPILFGLTSETNTGFSTTEFGDLFKLYNKTQISPVQDDLKELFRSIYGEDVLDIQPFTI